MKQTASRTTAKPTRAAPAADPVLFALLEAAHALEGRLEGALGALGLSGAKYSLLRQLARADQPLTLTELAAGQCCVRSNITQLVDRLEADGLVRRVDDLADRRSIRAALTAEGREKQLAGAAVVERVQAEVAALVPDRDRAALIRVLSALR
jgi:DNA-binding MarR family transcriptional regulator